MNRSGTYAVGVSAIILVALGLFRIFAGSDSPAEVAGGSIYIVAYDADTGSYASICDKNLPVQYCATSGDNSKLDFDGFTGANPISANTGFKLHLFDLGVDKNPYEAITICSTSTCDISAGDRTTVYIRASYDPNANPPLSAWVPDPKGNRHEPHFHDIKHGDPSAPDGQEDHRVDHMEYFTIEGTKVDPNQRFQCPDKGQGHKCTIYIGNRGFGLTISRLLHFGMK